MEGYQMIYKPIEIDRENLTLMGIPFPDQKSLDGCAHGIVSNMYEGFVPDPGIVEIIRDFCLDKIGIGEMHNRIKERHNGSEI